MARGTTKELLSNWRRRTISPMGLGGNTKISMISVVYTSWTVDALHAQLASKYILVLLEIQGGLIQI